MTGQNVTECIGGLQKFLIKISVVDTILIVIQDLMRHNQ